MTYTPDFVINGNIVIECKGWANDRWGFVRKLFLKFLLDNKNCKYEVVTDQKILQEKEFTVVPMLEMDDGRVLNYAAAAIEIGGIK